MRNVSPHIDIERPVLMAFDEVNGSLERVVVTPLSAVLHGLEDLDLINAIAKLGWILLRRMRPCGSGTDVPLPKMPGGIPVVPEQFRDRLAIPETEIADPAREAAGMPAGHEARPAGLTGHSRGVEPGEPHTPLGKAVDVRRLRIGVTVATEVAVAQVVGEDENDVGRPVRVRLRRHQRQESRAAGKHEAGKVSLQAGFQAAARAGRGGGLCSWHRGSPLLALF